LLKKGEMLHVGGGHANAGLGYVTNVVDLMLRGAELPVAVGRAYNASDGTTHTWRDFVEKLADIVGVKRPRLSLPKPVAYVVGWAMERTHALVGAQSRPLLTRMAVELLGTDQGFSINRARTDLGYRPTIDFDEGMQRVGLWLREIGAIEGARPFASH
jgi:nucleoside-diphosphate-sugar epimerase